MEKQLLINNKSLKEKQDIIKRLFDLSMQNDKEEPYLDFYKAGYDEGIQNYLIMNLYKENLTLNDRLVNALKYYKAKKAIPVDLIENLGIIYLDGTQENGFLLPLFSFRITDISKEKPFEVYSIEETEKINPRELLYKRLDELEQYLKNKNDKEQYEKLKQVSNRIIKKSKKTITGYNLKDIYYGLRPKRKKSKEIDEWR